MQDNNRKLQVEDVIRWLGRAEAGAEFRITEIPSDKTKNAKGRVLAVGYEHHHYQIGDVVVIDSPEVAYRRQYWEFVEDELTVFVRQVRKKAGIVDDWS